MATANPALDDGASARLRRRARPGLTWRQRQAARRIQKGERGDPLARWVTYAPVVATTIFCKIGVPPFAARGLGLGFPLLFLALIIGIVTGRVVLDLKRTVYFALLVSLLGLINLFRQETFSVTSLIFLGAVGMTYIFAVPRNGGIEVALRFFSNLAAVIAVCGIVQFFLQFVIGPRLAFPIESFLPTSLLVQGYHYLNPLYYGSPVLKSNGVFLQEASFFSQLVAVALVIELQAFKRIARLILLTLAILVSYSGTGLIILAVCLPILLVVERRVDVLFMLLGAALLFAILAVPLQLDIIVGRISEFTEPRSSAAMRFVDWIYLVGDELFKDPGTLLFGSGAGSFRDAAARVTYPVAEMMHAKMLVEYGLLGAFAYIGFLFYCIFTSPAPLVVRVAVAVLHFMAGAYSEPVTGIALSVLLLTARGARAPLLEHGDAAEPRAPFIRRM